MLFNSAQFLLLFLPTVLLGWWVVFRRPHYRLGFLAFASYVFYSAFEFPLGLWLLPLMLTSTTVDYVAGHLISSSTDQQRRKRVLVLALAFNLALLGIFKYLGFFEGTINSIAHLAGLGPAVPLHHIVLPIGISFYTFNSMSYTIDIYRRRVNPAESVLEYAAFVALFPHLIAGPIVRYSDIDDQLRALHRKLTPEMAAVGIFFLSCGLFKKLVIANALAGHVDRLWAHPGLLTVVSGWAAALGYSMQLYFDFSAYSDMAVGLALLLGLRFPQNFNSPYVAENISDFWNRWHMSLSRWMRDYLFIPLGGSRNGRLLTLRNLLITMFLGGLWHGAAWVFVLWGVGHGLLLVIHRVASDHGFVPPWRWMSRLITFVSVVLLWVLFRAGDVALVRAGTSLEVAGKVFAGMFGARGLGMGDITRSAAIGVSVPVGFLALVAGLIVFVNVAPNTWHVRFHPTRKTALVAAVMLAWSALMLSSPSPFLYFQF